MKDNIIYYKTTADFDNTGEVLIYKSLLELLRKQGKVCIDDSNKTPELFLLRIGINDSERLSNITKLSFNSSLWWSAFKNYFSKREIYFVTGIGAHSVKGIKSVIKNIAATLYCCGLRFLRVKLIRIGMSIQFSGKIPEISERFLSKCFNSYYVRDTISLENCRKANVSNVKLAPDLSWAYKINNENFSYNPNKIIFSFRDYAGTKNDQLNYKSKLQNAISELAQQITEIYPKAIFILTHQVNADLVFMQEIEEILKNKGINTILINELVTLENAAEFYSDANLVFSNRLHVLLLSYKYGPLPVALTDPLKHQKIKGIFEDAQIEDLLLDINMDENDLIERLQMINQNRDTKLLNLKSKEQKNRLELEQILTNNIQ